MTSSTGDYGVSGQWQPSVGTQSVLPTSHVQFVTTTTEMGTEMKSQQESAAVSSVREASFKMQEV